MFERLTLENFGVHRRLDLEPAAGLVGILGRNGSGKSTVLAAMEALVTGVVPTAGDNAENVNQSADLSEKSAVSGVLAHGGRRLEIARGFRHAKTTLSVDGGPTIQGAAKVNEKLLEIYGPAMTLMADYVFVKQGAIHAFLDATPAVRARALAQLFGTADAEICWSLLGKKLASIRVPATSGSLDVARRQAHDARVRLAALRCAKKSFDDLDGYDRDADPNSLTVARWEAMTRARDEVERLRITVESEREALAAAEVRVADAVQRQFDLAKAVADGGDDVDAAKVALASWKAYKRYHKAVDDLSERFNRLEDEKEAHPKPEPREHYIPSDDPVRMQLYRDIDHSLRVDRDFVAAFDSGDVVVCPTCGTPATALVGRLDESRRKIPLYEERVAGIEATISRDLAYEKALASWQSWHKAYREKVAQYNRDRAAIGDDEDAAPDATEDELRSVVDHHAALRSALAEAAAAYEAACRRRDLVEGRLASIVAERADAVADWEANRTNKTAYFAAKKALDATLVRIHERGRVLGEIKAMKRQRREADDEVARLEAEAAEAERLEKLVGRLSACRDVLHRDNLPRKVAQGYLALVEGGVNRLLDLFKADFRVAASDDLAFVAHFHAGPAAGAAQPAYRLSGGQKVLLAIAFRVEVNSLFAGELGLLCLDEPTQWLDDRNIGCLAPALAALRSLSADRGLQCFLVTHERSLSRLFDSVVSLDDNP